MMISPAGVDLVKQFEGCKLTAYQDVVGVWTIGYGHTDGVKQGNTITQEQADQLLTDDLHETSSAVSNLLKVEVTQSQFDALVSLAFNVGVNAVANSTLLALVNAGKTFEAAEQFCRWNHAGGVVVAGLTRRRYAEKDLFEGTANA